MEWIILKIISVVYAREVFKQSPFLEEPREEDGSDGIQFMTEAVHVKILL